MPAESMAQAMAARIAKHAPGKLYARNRGMLDMSKADLHKYAKTKSKGMPYKRGLDLRSNPSEVSKYVKGRRKKMSAAY